ncbi:MAG: M48 family metalloprotease [Nodosilinea sp. LVE1205-7]|jgi:Zn-dependent protease with chaperone function
MALIRTHQGLGNQALARRLCQQLLTSQSSQVREWAIQVLQTYPSPAVDHRHGPAAEANTSQSLFDYQRLNRLVAEVPGKVNPGNSSGGRFFSLAAHQRLVLHTLQGLTAIALIWLISLIIHSGLWSFNRLMRLISWPIPLYGLPGFDPPTTSLILGLLVILALASPWLMDWMLSRAYGQHPLPLSQLQRDHPDALRLLRRVCQQQGWSLPPLRLLPVATPLCFSYGWGGGQTRLVVSQGLLKETASQTLTTLCSYELAHRVNGDLPVMTTLGVLLLGCHRGYCQLAAWSDRHLGVVRWLLTLAAVTCYGGFWGLRQLALALSRCRSRLCDRQVVALTQNPSALQQSLIDLTLALVRDVKRRGNLHPWG